MTELELLGQISADIKTIISMILLFELVKMGKGIYSMWKGGIKS
jgi:hypothetical protein